MAISGEQTYPALLQDLPTLWTVWISPRGEGLTGRRNLFPLPCLPHSNHRMSWRPPLRPCLGTMPGRISGGKSYWRSNVGADLPAETSPAPVLHRHPRAPGSHKRACGGCRHPHPEIAR